MNLDNANKISQANSNNNASTGQNTNDNEDRQDNPQNENTKITNTSACVSVGEIWNDNLKQFDGANLLQLIKYATNSTITIDNISAIKNRTINSSTMRGYNSNRDILVTLGGLQWNVPYFSQDINGNPILTLWLANSNQLSGKSVYSNNGSVGATPTKITFNSSGQSTWNSGFSPNNNPGSNYPDAMYGVSYIRSVILNNGGWYAISTGGGSGITFTKKIDSIFSPFTITTKDITGSTTLRNRIADYIVTPINVDWQKNQSFRIITGGAHGYDLSNDGWATGQPASNYYSNFNFSNKDKYNTWKDDRLWIPSLSETGNISAYIGLWKPTANQNSNIHYTWTRSSDSHAACYAYILNPNGESHTVYQYVSSSFGVRPALHLNLATAVESIKDIWASTNFFSYNLNRVLKYVSGNNTTATNDSLLNSLSSTIGNGAMLSSTIKTNANKVTDKAFINASSELVIKFGGLYWFAVYLTKNTSGQIILTMWLADSGQLYSKNKVSSTAYNKYGSGTFNSGSPPYKDGASTISNNYGNNYIRTTLLSSGNTTSVFYPYTKTTTNKTAIGDFIISPNALNTQDKLNLQKSQTAKSTLGFRYNLPNENYSNLINYSNTYKALSLSASTTNYTAWQNDKLWLPSLSEVGLGTNNTISTNSTASNNLRTAGLWGLSTAQRSNTNKTATWLRSGHITDKNLAYIISSDGLDYGYETIDTQNGIRPALHLNLTLACQYSS